MFPLLVFSDYVALRFPVRSDSLAAHFFPELVGHSAVSSGGPLLSPQVLVASCDEPSGPGRAWWTWASLVQLDEPVYPGLIEEEKPASKETAICPDSLGQLYMLAVTA